MTSSKNVIIYSHKSQNCRNLLHNMKNCGIISLFRHIDISAPGIVVPQGVTDIPTLLVANISQPLIGADAFRWVNDTRKWKDQNARTTQMMNANIYNWNMLKSTTQENDGLKGLLPYEETAMSSFSDKFCLLKDDILPQQYVGISESIRIYTAPDEKNKLSKHTQEKLLKDEKEKRQNQDNFNKQNIETLLEKSKKGELTSPSLPVERLLDDNKNNIQNNSDKIQKPTLTQNYQQNQLQHSSQYQMQNQPQLQLQSHLQYQQQNQMRHPLQYQSQSQQQQQYQTQYQPQHQIQYQMQPSSQNQMSNQMTSYQQINNQSQLMFNRPPTYGVRG